MDGLNDGATGAIIPYLETFYNIGYAIVSLVFVTNALGFIVAAPVVQTIDSKWGRSRAYVLSTSLNECRLYYACLCSTVSSSCCVVLVAGNRGGLVLGHDRRLGGESH